MSKAQHPEFNLDFIKDSINQWSLAATNYHREAEKAYTRMRSYLTLYQFRLSEQEKCDIREMLSQHLDEIDQYDLVTDMDNYLAGFCFKLDKSVLPSLKTEQKPKPTAVNIKIASTQNQTKSPEPPQSSKNFIQQPIVNQNQEPLPELENTILDTLIPANFHDNAVDYNDLDFYARQFYQ